MDGRMLRSGLPAGGLRERSKMEHVLWEDRVLETVDL